MQTRLIIGVLGCLFLVGLSLAYGQEDSSRATEAPEELLEFDDIEVVEEDNVSPSSLTSLVGNLHPAVIHFPIAWMALLCLVELVGLAKQRSDWHQAGLYLLLLAVVSFVPAVTTGLIQYGRITFAGKFIEIAHLHRNLNLFAAGTAILALFLRGRLSLDTNRMHRLVYVATIVVATGLVLFSSYLGGRLVHG